MVSVVVSSPGCQLFGNVHVCYAREVVYKHMQAHWHWERMQTCAAAISQQGHSGHSVLGVKLGWGLQVPYWQSKIVQGCRKRGKPVIVATNMLESMIDNPTPTRAEVAPLRHSDPSHRPCAANTKELNE